MRPRAGRRQQQQQEDANDDAEEEDEDGEEEDDETDEAAANGSGKRWSRLTRLDFKHWLRGRFAPLGGRVHKDQLPATIACQ